MKRSRLAVLLPALLAGAFLFSALHIAANARAVSGIGETGCDGSKQPLLLIHGWGGSDDLYGDDAGMARLYQWLAEDGYVPECNLFYVRGVSALNSRDQNRRNIQLFIRDAYRQRKLAHPAWNGHFDIIGHSYGGLNARYYLESPYYEADRMLGIHVDNLFTLGSPHGGVFLSTEAYPGALFIAGQHLFSPRNLNDYLSAAQLHAAAMALYNMTHSQPAGTCYRLIGGDFMRQSGVPWAIRALYWLPPWSFNPGDMGVSARSSLHLATNPTLAPGYKHTVAVYNGDMHGYYDGFGLQNLRSYVHPDNTYREVLRDALGAPLSQCQRAEQSVAQGAPPARINDATAMEPVLLGEGVLAPAQRAIVRFPVDWSGPGVIYVAWQASAPDSLLDFDLVDAQGTTITPEGALLDPNIAYDQLAAAGGGLATYVISDTVAGQWRFDLDAPGAGYPITYTVYAHGASDLTARAFAPAWQRSGAPVVLTSTVMTGQGPVTDAVVMATVTDPDGIGQIVKLADDGIAPDTTAQDGIYAGQYEDGWQGGYYGVWVDVTGSNAEHSFRRNAQTTFAISPATVTLLGSHNDQPIDEDGDGYYDALQVSAGVQVQETGVVALSAVLATETGQRIEQRTVLVEVDSGGTQTITLTFSGEAIFASGVDGPYAVTDVVLMDDDSFLILDQDGAGWLTAPYAREAFAPGRYRAHLPLIMD